MGGSGGRGAAAATGASGGAAGAESGPASGGAADPATGTAGAAGAAIGGEAGAGIAGAAAATTGGAAAAGSGGRGTQIVRRQAWRRAWQRARRRHLQQVSSSSRRGRNGWMLRARAARCWKSRGRASCWVSPPAAAVVQGWEWGLLHSRCQCAQRRCLPRQPCLPPCFARRRRLCSIPPLVCSQVDPCSPSPCRPLRAGAAAGGAGGAGEPSPWLGIALLCR